MKRLLIPFLALGIGMASITQSASAISNTEALKVAMATTLFLAKCSSGGLGALLTLWGAYLTLTFNPATANNNFIDPLRPDIIGPIALYFGVACLTVFGILHLGEHLVKRL